MKRRSFLGTLVGAVVAPWESLQGLWARPVVPPGLVPTEDLLREAEDAPWSTSTLADPEEHYRAHAEYLRSLPPSRRREEALDDLEIRTPW